jgi:hypothetical protein
VKKFHVTCRDISNEKKSLTLSMAKPRYNAKAILKTYEMVIYGVIHYLTNSLCKNVLKIVTHKARL